MKLFSTKFIVFFVVVAIATMVFGVFVNQEAITALFLARVFFTACITTLIYFVVSKRNERKPS